MPQNVPAFDFSDPAKALRQFVYDFWCEHGHGPNLRAVHEGTGLDRRTIVQGYKELQLGIICVVDQDSVNCNLLKFQPFSSFPSQVEVWIDGRFHSYAGCALESVAISKMPPFAGKELTLKSYCACCLGAIELTATDGVVTAPGGCARARQHLAVGLEQRRHHPPVRLHELRPRCRPRRAVRDHRQPAGRAAHHRADGHVREGDR